MKRQLVVIHGGDTYNSYEEFLEGLSREKLNYEDLFKKGWKKTLAEKLGDSYEVITSRFPNELNARYLEWKIWFEKIAPFLRDGVIFLGHSLGGMFLARYLEENDFPKKIKATLIVASPHTDNLKQKLADFFIPKTLKNFEKQAGEVYLYYSSDDPLVSNALEHLKSYQTALTKTHSRTFSDRGHFTGEEFPEILEDIRKL